MVSWYSALLVAHSYLRWGVLGMSVVCVARAAHGWARRRPFERADERVVRVLLSIVDTQLLLGLLLYAGLSPITGAALHDVRGAMSNSVLRFFSLEHQVAMVAAIAVLHVGLLRAKRLGADPKRHRSVLVSTAAALVLFVVGVPWPGLPYARPLLRWLA